MKILSELHRNLLGGYRLQALVRHLEKIPPTGASVLDVGCGNGKLAAGLKALRPDLDIEGIDLHTAVESSISMTFYDGKTIPFPDGSWDVCMANDVLHHCDDPFGLLEEMRRVGRKMIILKDHLAENWVDLQLLRAMDWLGNVGDGTPLPYKFLSSNEWEDIFLALELTREFYTTDLKLYPRVFLNLLDRELHFLCVLNLTK